MKTAKNYLSSRTIMIAALRSCRAIVDDEKHRRKVVFFIIAISSLILRFCIIHSERDSFGDPKSNSRQVQND